MQVHPPIYYLCGRRSISRDSRADEKERCRCQDASGMFAGWTFEQARKITKRRHVREGEFIIAQLSL